MKVTSHSNLDMVSISKQKQSEKVEELQVDNQGKASASTQANSDIKSTQYLEKIKATEVDNSAKIENIKAALKAGTYQVDEMSIAAKLIKENQMMGD